MEMKKRLTFAKAVAPPPSRADRLAVAKHTGGQKMTVQYPGRGPDIRMPEKRVRLIGKLTILDVVL